MPAVLPETSASFPSSFRSIVKTRLSAGGSALALCRREIGDDHTPMKLPPFLLDQWLAAHEFADPPIRYNLASSTGPQWSLGDLLALSEEAGDPMPRREIDQLKLSYAPPQGGARLRERIAALQGV